MKQKESLKAFAIRLWEITQKMIQSKAIVLQYSYRFAMDAFGYKMGSSHRWSFALY